MKLLMKVMISTNMLLSPFNNKLTDSFSVSISQKEDIQWIYKSKDGMIYRRQFNYTNDSWMGEWELCLSSFTDDEIKEDEQYADDIVATMRDHGATENTIFLKLDSGGLLWNPVTDIREQYPAETAKIMYLNDIWVYKKEECLKAIAKKDKNVNL